ncbi:MAG: MFS transporter [Cyclobacteriaceae bacterium]|nr:MFS transporter [Cyclobacteriaceae bacterium]
MEFNQSNQIENSGRDKTSSVKKNKKRGFTLFALILAGEAIFFLPFVIARIFRPTLLAVFEITNTQLGAFFSVYGIIAMVSYFFGGPLADRFSTRNLMAIALWLTGMSGFIFATVPSHQIVYALYAFWGITTILLFWAALIRATREWGGSDFQGRAFGLLEAGRGATAALLGSVSVLIFSYFNPEEAAQTFSQSRRESFQDVILMASGITFLSGVLVWIFVPKTSTSHSNEPVITRSTFLKLLLTPTVWMLAVIIVCAYVGYKITDNFSLYVKDVLGVTETQAATVGTLALWMRMIVALIAGYFADRFSGVKIIIVCFALNTLGSLAIGLGFLTTSFWFVGITFTSILIGVYGVRVLYFAVLEEARIPLFTTGTVVGIISFIGFTPDIFMSPLAGYLLDQFPGVQGHQFVFFVLMIFSILGMATSFLFFQSQKNMKSI